MPSYELQASSASTQGAVVLTGGRMQSDIDIQRRCYSQKEFDAEFFSEKRISPPLGQETKSYFREHLCPTRKCLLAWLKRHVPMIGWLKEYQPSWIPGDITAGVTIGVIHIPFGMAYGLLTGLPPVHGLYSSFFPVILYSLLGSSRHISIGTFAVISLMIASAISKYGDVQASVYANGTLPMDLASGTDLPLASTAWTEGSSAWPDGVTGSAWPEGVATTESEHSPAGQGRCVTTSASSGGMSKEGTQQMLLASMGLTFLVGLIQLVMGLLHLGMVNTYMSDSIVSGLTTGAAVHVLVSQIKDVFGIKIKSKERTFVIVGVLIEAAKHLHETNLAAVLISGICMLVLFVIKIHVNERFKERLKVPIPTELFIVVIGTAMSWGVDFEGRWCVKIVGDVPKGLPKPRLPAFSLIASMGSDAFSIAIVSFALNISLSRYFAKKHGYRIDANQELVAYGLSNIFASFFEAYASCTSLSRSLLQDGAGGKTQAAGFLACGILLIILLFVGPYFRTLPLPCLAAIIITSLKGMFMQFLELKYLWRVSKIELMQWLVTFTGVVVLDVAPGLLIGVVFSLFVMIVRTQLAEMSLLGRVSKTEMYHRVDLYRAVEEVPDTKIVRFEAPLYYANGYRFKKLTRQLAPIPKKRKAALHTLVQEDTLEQGAALRHLVIDCSPMTFIDTNGAKALIKILKEYRKAGVTVHLCNYRVNMLELFESGGFMDDVGRDTLQMTIHDAVARFDKCGPELQQASTPAPPVAFSPDLAHINDAFQPESSHDF